MYNSITNTVDKPSSMVNFGDHTHKLCHSIHSPFHIGCAEIISS